MSSTAKLRYEGKILSRDQICRQTNISRNRVRYFMRLYKANFIEAINGIEKMDEEWKSNQERKEIYKQYKAEGETEICSEFGCPAKLSITEKLCGDKCIKHHPDNEENSEFADRIFVG